MIRPLLISDASPMVAEIMKFMLKTGSQRFSTLSTPQGKPESKWASTLHHFGTFRTLAPPKELAANRGFATAGLSRLQGLALCWEERNEDIWLDDAVCGRFPPSARVGGITNADFFRPAFKLSPALPLVS